MSEPADEPIVIDFTDVPDVPADYYDPEMAAEEAQAHEEWVDSVTTDDLDQWAETLSDARSPILRAVPEGIRGKSDDWAEADSATILANGIKQDPPCYLVRTDGAALLYAGKVHSIAGEPESGKGWFACHAAAQVLAGGEHVLYIDFEDTSEGIVRRMIEAGVPAEIVVSRLHVVNPVSPFNADAKLHLAFVLGTIVNHLKEKVGLVVFDGVTQALANQGVESNDNDGVARMFNELFRWARDMEGDGSPAVLLVDHVVKSKDERGRWPIGAGTKLAAIDGVQFKAEVVHPLGHGRDGLVRISVTKDRPGFVRGHAVGNGHQQQIADLEAKSLPGGRVLLKLVPPVWEQDEHGVVEPTTVMERVKDALRSANRPLMRTELYSLISGNTATKVKAVTILVSQGVVAEVGNKLVLAELELGAGE